LCLKVVRRLALECARSVAHSHRGLFSMAIVESFPGGQSLSAYPEVTSKMEFIEGRWRSKSQKSVTFKVLGTNETLDVPLLLSTTVLEAKGYIADKTMVEADKIDFYVKAGAYTKKLKDIDQLPSTTLVKGIKKFEPAKHVWPHPMGIIGQGYHGLKTTMTYLMDGNTNIIAWDRNSIFGGYCWITGANKTSRLQTELGSFHIWWGQHCIDSGKVTYPNCREINDTAPDQLHGSPTENNFHMWPYKAEILRMFNQGAEAYGCHKYVNFDNHVSTLEIVGDKDAESRYYNITAENLKEPGTFKTYPVSCLFSYPGSLTQNRIIEYPGEDVFDGEIRYGMNDDTPYDKLKGSTIAILGNGAFAVENARTCLECEGVKAYIVTRRKNLASPRMPCWFVHQGPIPCPGGFVLKMFEAMYEHVGFGDPWQYWSVHANAERTNVSIIQNSRFGIGDVTFLMVAWGLLEYVVGTVKRFSRHTLHISNGEKLEGVTVVLKALGLLGDYSVDKLHNMKEMVGAFCAGDWRRMLQHDATGMNAANFTTFSTGIGTTDFTITYKYLYDYPKEWYRCEANSILKQLPKHKEEPEIDKPACVVDVKFAMVAGVVLDGMLPKLQPSKAWFSDYKHEMYHKSHNTERALEVALHEWDKYQKNWKDRGIKHDYVPYPYTKEIVATWFEDYTDLLKVPISVDGPGPEGWKVSHFYDANGPTEKCKKLLEENDKKIAARTK